MKFREFLEESKPGRAWNGRLEKIDELLKWMYSTDILNKGLDTIFSKLKWYTYDDYKNTISSMLSGVKIMFSNLCLNKHTGVKDHWQIRIFLKTNTEIYVSGEKYILKDVISSSGFYKYMKAYIHKNFKNEIYFKLSIPSLLNLRVY